MQRIKTTSRRKYGRTLPSPYVHFDATFSVNSRLEESGCFTKERTQANRTLPSLLGRHTRTHSHRSIISCWSPVVPVCSTTYFHEVVTIFLDLPSNSQLQRSSFRRNRARPTGQQLVRLHRWTSAFRLMNPETERRCETLDL